MSAPEDTIRAYHFMRMRREELIEAAEALLAERDALREAGKQWLAETAPGQHINSAKGRSMMRRAIEGGDRG